jgi:hypothetical protein
MLSIGVTARLAALQRMIELFPDQPTITVVDSTHRPVGVIDVARIRSAHTALVVRDVMVALRA